MDTIDEAIDIFCGHFTDEEEEEPFPRKDWQDERPMSPMEVGLPVFDFGADLRPLPFVNTLKNFREFFIATEGRCDQSYDVSLMKPNTEGYYVPESSVKITVSNCEYSVASQIERELFEHYPSISKYAALYINSGMRFSASEFSTLRYQPGIPPIKEKHKYVALLLFTTLQTIVMTFERPHKSMFGYKYVKTYLCDANFTMDFDKYDLFVSNTHRRQEKLVQIVKKFPRVFNLNVEMRHAQSCVSHREPCRSCVYCMAAAVLFGQHLHQRSTRFEPYRHGNKGTNSRSS